MMKSPIPLLILLVSCASPTSAPQESAGVVTKNSSEKINGISVTAASQPIDQNELSKICNVNANYVCLLPFAFVQDKKPKVYYNSGFQEWGERPEGIAAC